MPAKSHFSIDQIEIPERRVDNISIAKSIADAAARSHNEYRKKIRLQKEHLDGKPPFDPKVLEDTGQSWRNNWPRGKARAKTEKLVIDEIASFMAAIGTGEVAFSRFDKKKHSKKEKLFLNDDTLRSRYGAMISMAYADLWDKMPRATDFVQTLAYESVNWGWCFTTCEQDDWIGVAHPVLNVGFPPRTRVELVNLAVVQQEYSATELYQTWVDLVKGKELDEGYANFWNQQGLEEALYHAYRGKKGSEDTWATIRVDYCRDVRLSIEESDVIRITRIINEELDGSVTDTLFQYQSVFHDGTQASYQSGSVLLYQRNHDGVKFDEVGHLFRDSNITPSGMIQDMKGIAQYSVSDSLRHDRSLNHIDDLIQVTGGLTFTQDTANMGEKFSVYVAGPFSILPANYSLADNLLPVNLTNHVAFRQMEEQTYLRDTGHYDPTIQGKLGDRATSKEVEAATREVGQSSRSRQNLKVENWSRYHTAVFKRLGDKSRFNNTSAQGKEAQEWFVSEIRYLLDLEDDDAAFAVLEEIECFELELMNADSQALLELLRLAQHPRERNMIMRRYKMALGIGRRVLDKTHPRFDEAAEVLRDEQLAQVENGMFGNSVAPLFSEEDQDVPHLNVHFRYLSQIPEQAQQGAIDPLRAAKIMTEGLSHTPLHIRALSQDPIDGKKQAEQYQQVQKQLEGIAKEIQQAAERAARQMAQNQQQQQRGGAEEQARAEENAQRTQQREVAHAQKTQHKDEDHQNKLRIEQEKAALNINETRAKAAIGLQEKAASATISLREKGSKAKDDV